MKDNLPILEVKALGGFSMRYGEKTISIGSGKSTKAVKLLQILVCSEGRTVSRERLLDMLYGNEDITDAANNLRVTTFRLKKMLVTAGLPQYDLYTDQERHVFLCCTDGGCAGCRPVCVTVRPGR